MGPFDDPLFDLNGDGKTDEFETFVGLQMMAGSRQEAIDMTGDDTFYMGSDEIDEDDGDDEFDDDDMDRDEYDDDFDEDDDDGYDDDDY